MSISTNWSCYYKQARSGEEIHIRERLGLHACSEKYTIKIYKLGIIIIIIITNILSSI